MNENRSSERNPVARFFSWLWGFLIRLVLVVIFGVVIGATLYYIGLPNIYGAQFRAISENTNRLTELDTAQKIANNRVAERLSSLQERIVNLEIFRDDSNVTIGSYQEKIDTISTGQEAQGTLLNTKIEQLTTELDSISKEIEGINQNLTGLSDDLKSIEATAESADNQLAQDVEENKLAISAISDTLKINGTPLEDLEREIKILKVLELITRSRLSIYGENFGLAKRDIQSAIDLLVQIQQTAPAYQASVISDIANRLSGVMANLPDEPILAVNDLEFAWQLLIDELPGISPLSVTSTITSSTVITGTSTTPEATILPTSPSTENMTPTITPMITPTPTQKP